MKRQFLHTVWGNISGEAAGEIWHWSLLKSRELKLKTILRGEVSLPVPSSRHVHHGHFLILACGGKIPRGHQTSLLRMRMGAWLCCREGQISSRVPTHQDAIFPQSDNDTMDMRHQRSTKRQTLLDDVVQRPFSFVDLFWDVSGYPARFSFLLLHNRCVDDAKLFHIRRHVGDVVPRIGRERLGGFRHTSGLEPYWRIKL